MIFLDARDKRFEPYWATTSAMKTVGESESLDEALDAAHRQICDRDDAAELRSRGATPIHALAAAFRGKRVKVTAAGEQGRVAPPVLSHGGGRASVSASAAFDA